MDDDIAKRARELAGRGNLIGARELYAQLLADQEERLGDADPQTLQTLNDLAAIHLRLSEFALAAKMAGNAMKGRTRVLGAEHPDTLRSSYLLAAVLHDAGETQAARLGLEGLLPIFRRVFGPSAPETREVIEELARLLRASGDPGAAELEAQLPRFDYTVGDSWTLVNSMATLAAESGKVDEAERTLRLILEAPGAPPSAIALASFNLGILLKQKGEPVAAMSAFRRAAELGDAEVVSRAFTHLGLLLGEQGNALEAATAYEQAMKHEGQFAVESATQLGRLRHRRGELAMAEKAYAYAMKSSDARYWGLARLGLAEVLVQKGDLRGAERLYREVSDAEVPLARAAREALDELNQRGR